MEKAREFQKNIYFCFIDYAKTFDCVDHNELWKILKEKRIPDHLTCLLRNLYTDQEALISHASKLMLKILQARIQQYIYWEPPGVQADLEKTEEPEIKLPTSVGSSKK